MRFTPRISGRSPACLAISIRCIMDPVAARRIVAGEPIVHGVHLLLRALEGHFESGDQHPLCAISARFEHPDRRSATRSSSERHGPTSAVLSRSMERCRLVDDHRRRVRGRAGASGGRGYPSEGVRALCPSVRAVRTLRGHRRRQPAPSRCTARRRSDAPFRRRASASAPTPWRRSPAISRLMGMECPGRDSLLSALPLRM